MSKLKSKITCCGLNLRDENITLIKILLFSTPYLWILAAVFTGLWWLARLFPSAKILCRNASRILSRNYDLICDSNLMPKIRCLISSKLYRWSPQMSGVIYKNFNILCLSTLWLMCIAGTLALIHGTINIVSIV
jgi:hypothetical protein